MSLDFPSAPTVGQTYPPYVWDGEKWDYVGQGAPGTANVKMSDTPPADAIPGDLWCETDSGFVYVLVDDGTSLQWAVTNPVMPVAGPQGEQGIQGIPGNTILYGPSDPTAGQGVDGNFYINITSSFMFGPKAAGAWPAGASLIGPQGIQGIQGIQGVPGDMTQAMADLRYLKLTGGMLGGDLSITKINAALTLDKAASTQYAVIRGNMGNVRRWAFFLGDAGAETGADAGSEFSINRYSDTGTALGAALTIKRSDGETTLNGNGAALVLNQTGASNDTNFSRITYSMGGLKRWEISGAWGVEAAGNDGSDFSIDRFDNAGVYIDSMITINRQTGVVFTGSSLSVNGGKHSWPLSVRTGVNANLGIFDGGAGIANFGCINDAGDTWNTLNLISKVFVSNTFTPASNGGANLGTAALRFATVYTQDLSLSNGIGDWTIVEGEDDLFIYNNRNDKVYKFALYEVAPATAPPKKVE